MVVSGWETLRERFPIGALVIATDYAIERNIHREGKRYGRVVGYGASWNLVRILCHGIKTPYSYSVDFWKPMFPQHVKEFFEKRRDMDILLSMLGEKKPIGFRESEVNREENV